MSRRDDGVCEACETRPATRIVSITDLDGVLEELAHLCERCAAPIDAMIP